MQLKIAVVVHGRFYAFDLVRELIQQGHDITLFTNYPARTVARFGIPETNVRSFVLHGILSRIVHLLNSFGQLLHLGPFIHSWFSQWVAHELVRADYDIVHAFSGVAEEVFSSLDTKKTHKILVRGSSHIRTQARLLEEEESRAGLAVDKPSTWMIGREEREYRLADQIVVLSTFARDSFLDHGINAQHLKILPLGAQLGRFRPPASLIEERCQRVLSGQPLHVLMVGTFSLRKGAIDLLKLASSTGSDFQFRFVGAIADDAKCLIRSDQSTIEFIPKQPQFELPSMYAWADLFIFPTIEDGYAVVLSQAQAAGLPILATTNCAAPDIVSPGESGWIFSIRDPDAFAHQLKWCNEHRQELAYMVKQIYATFQPRDWADVAKDFATLCTELLNETKG